MDKTINKIKKAFRKKIDQDKEKTKRGYTSKYNLYGFIPKQTLQKKLILKTRKVMMAY